MCRALLACRRASRSPCHTCRWVQPLPVHLKTQGRLPQMPCDRGVGQAEASGKQCIAVCAGHGHVWEPASSVPGLRDASAVWIHARHACQAGPAAHDGAHNGTTANDAARPDDALLPRLPPAGSTPSIAVREPTGFIWKAVPSRAVPPGSNAPTQHALEAGDMMVQSLRRATTCRP